MPKKIPISKLGLLTLGLLAALSLCSCAGQSTSHAPDFDSAYQNEVKPYSFNYAAWEAGTFSSMLKQKLSGSVPSTANDAQVVFEYFQTISQLEQIHNQLGQIRALDSTAGLPDIETRSVVLRLVLESDQASIERILSRQISLALAESGIYNPAAGDWLKITFPPVSFELEPSLSILVVSPREKIERMKETIIKPDITFTQSDQLEAALESHNVSALVIPLGGLGATYPSFVIESSDLRYSLAVIAEEWLHQYMLFRPLGFRYVLELAGLIHDPDIAALNETAVGIAAQEIGDLVYQRYYAAYYPTAANVVPEPPLFDFNAAMREIRLNVDAYLAAGQAEKAESYMEEQRQILISHGYYIRRLNQAYFAFYGSYAYAGTSVDPIGDQFKQMRKNSLGLKEYIRTASGLTSRQALQDSLSQPK
jgi:hypothetical protein